MRLDPRIRVDGLIHHRIMREILYIREAMMYLHEEEHSYLNGDLGREGRPRCDNRYCCTGFSEKFGGRGGL